MGSFSRVIIPSITGALICITAPLKRVKCCRMRALRLALLGGAPSQWCAHGHGQSLVVNGGHVLLLWKFGKKKISPEQCHAKEGSQVSSEQFPTGRAETTGTNPQHTGKLFQEV